MVAGIQGLVTASGFRGVDAVVIAEGTGTNRLAALSAWTCPGAGTCMVIRTNPLPRLLPNVPVVYASPVGNDLRDIYLRQFVDGRLITGEGARDSPAEDDSEPHGDALPTLLEVLEQEAEDRRQRRILRLLRESRLPLGKTWETFEHHRMPLALRQKLDHLARAVSWSTASTSWPSDCPALARPTPCAPWGTGWWRPATPSSLLQPTA